MLRSRSPRSTRAQSSAALQEVPAHELRNSLMPTQLDVQSLDSANVPGVVREFPECGYTPSPWRRHQAIDSGHAFEVATRHCKGDELPWCVATADGTMMPANHVLHQGEAFQFFAASERHPLPLGLCAHLPAATKVCEVLRPSIQPSARIRILRQQGCLLADDQVQQALEYTASQAAYHVQVISPMVMLAAVQQVATSSLAPICTDLQLGAVHLITALPVSGHWVALAWKINSCSVQAWEAVAGHRMRPLLTKRIG